MKKSPKQVLSKYDHRTLNQTLKMFTFLPKVGSSLPIWLPNGTTFKMLLQDYCQKLEQAHGFTYVTSPVLAKESLYRTSGHLAHYQEYMFPAMEVNEQKLRLRPMTCPHHCLIFNYQNYSYHDLPIRLAENSLLFRYEKSGAIHGLERVRQMELKDSHIFVPQDLDLITQEIRNCLEMTQKLLDKLGLSNQISLDLSLHDPIDSDKYYQDTNLWTETEKILTNILNQWGKPYQTVAGEAAFYGPKIDFQFTTHLGHRITVATIQLDFLLAEKFRLKYRTANQIAGQEFGRPIIIHHGIIGTYERLLALLLEHHQGWLPLWLTPVQAEIFVITSDDQALWNYAEKIMKFLTTHGIRVKLMTKSKHLKENLKQAWEEKVPFHLFVGAKELANNTVTFYHHKTRTNRENTDLFQFLHRVRDYLSL